MGATQITLESFDCRGLPSSLFVINNLLLINEPY